MSWNVTEHRCTVCKGYYEIWEHNESNETHFHTVALKNTNLKPLCKCRPLPNGEK